MVSSAHADSSGPGAGRVALRPPGRPPAGARRVRLLSATAVAGIGAGTALLLAVCLAGPSRAVVPAPPLSAGPPWTAHLRPETLLVSVSLWAGAVLGCVGVAAGLAAVARGARPSSRLLVAAALVVTAAFTVLPPAGSTDVLDYAAYGESVVLGHNPYTTTPHKLRVLGNPVGLAAPSMWSKSRSVYGPLATLEQAAAAELGGASADRIAFWLKLWNSLAFLAVVLALDRVLRRDGARRARAHLWWSLNPLLMWNLVASGHIDALAAAAGLAGVLLARPVGRAAPAGRRRPFAPSARRLRPRIPAGPIPAAPTSAAPTSAAPTAVGPTAAAPIPAARALACGAMVGVAADLKITFVVFGLGIAWAARRSPRTVALAAAGALAVLVPSYLWFGLPAVTVLLLRDASATSDNFYRLIARALGFPSMPHLGLVALPLLAALAWLLLRRLPEGDPGLPAVRPALALSAAWLLIWPYQRPWYDAMAICLLALYPATGLDWPLLVRLWAVTMYSMPGLPLLRGLPPLPRGWLGAVSTDERLLVIPLIRLATLAVVVSLACGAWTARRGKPAAVSARSSVAAAPGPAARAPADALPAPGCDAADPPGAPPPGPG